MDEDTKESSTRGWLEARQTAGVGGSRSKAVTACAVREEAGKVNAWAAELHSVKRERTSVAPLAFHHCKPSAAGLEFMGFVVPKALPSLLT